MGDATLKVGNMAHKLNLKSSEQKAFTNAPEGIRPAIYE